MKVAIPTGAPWARLSEATPVIRHAQNAAVLDDDLCQQIEALPDKRSLEDLPEPGAASGKR